MTVVRYETGTWSEEQVGALLTAAEELAVMVSRRQDNEVVVETTDFPGLFRKMADILSGTPGRGETNNCG